MKQAYIAMFCPSDTIHAVFNIKLQPQPTLFFESVPSDSSCLLC